MLNRAGLARWNHRVDCLETGLHRLRALAAVDDAGCQSFYRERLERDDRSLCRQWFLRQLRSDTSLPRLRRPGTSMMRPSA